jgi:molybdopterin-guanine dinucleotide biosynthesis protein B
MLRFAQHKLADKMHAVAITGWSGTGKTTLIVELIARLVARGKRVAAIKHTHHALNDRKEGDTARFRNAGADPVMLAGDKEAIVNGARVTYDDPRELLGHIDSADIVLIEGFKSYNGWPRIEAPASTDDAMAILDRILAP